MGSYKELAHNSDLSFLVLNKTKPNTEQYHVLPRSFTIFFFFPQNKCLQSAGPVIKGHSVSKPALLMQPDISVCYSTVRKVNQVRTFGLLLSYIPRQKSMALPLFYSMNRCGFNHIQKKMLTSFRLWLWYLGVKLLSQRK